MKNFFKSFPYAFKGLSTAFTSEFNLRFHCAFAVIVMAAALYLQVTRTQFCVLLLCCGLVISAEIFNTAIETLTDLISPDENELARKTKDMAAAAVLITAITSVIIGAIIFLPRINQ